MEKVFGIDLGTTYSCIAYVDEYGKPVVVKNGENELTTPSVVFFDEKEIIVGRVAKEQLKVDPEKVVAFVKRDMGNPGFMFTHDGVEYKPEEISARILQKLVNDASANVGFEIKNVVITCPAYFGINERKATELAGEIAGLNVKAIINEPTAAAIAYGIDKVENQTVLVYDLGGGTFDVTIIKVSPEKVEVVVTGGDHNLGGKNWDDALMSYFASCFAEQTGVQDDIFSDVTTLGSIQLIAEETKKTLSSRDKYRTSIVYGTDDAKIEVTREKFDEITSDLAERTIVLTNQMLDEAKAKGVTTFDKILLVGGSTRMKQITEILTKNFPGKPVEMFDPDESVAKGAALYGQQLAVNGELIKKLAEQTGKKEEDIDISTISETELNKAAQSVASATGFALGNIKKSAHTKIVNVVSKSFGVRAYVNKTEEKIINIIKKQTPIPEATVTRDDFSTLEDNMDTIEVVVFENEYASDTVEISESKEIGNGVINGLPPNLPAGSPIRVTFKIDENGLLDVEALSITGNKKVNFQIQTTDVMSQEEVEAAKKRGLSIKVS